MSRPDVIVVGGGVIGSAVAFALARRGLTVTLHERDALASHASGAAAGMLAPLAESALGEPSRLWGWRALEGLPGLASELSESTGIDPEWVPSGVLRVARDDAEAERLRRNAERDREHGCVWLDGAAARAAAPGLSDACPGAIFSPHEGHVRSPLLARAYARAAQQRGARLETGSMLSDLAAQDAGAIVLCAGCWTPVLAPGLPIEPVRGQIVSLDAPDPPFAPIVWGGSTYLVPKRDGSLVIGATEEHVGFDCRTTAAGVAGLLESAAALVPGLDGASFRGAWAGLRPGTPDGLPLVGFLPSDRVLVAAGHHRNGVLLSFVTGELIADLVEGKAPPPDAAAFAPDRFATV